MEFERVFTENRWLNYSLINYTIFSLVLELFCSACIIVCFAMSL